MKKSMPLAMIAALLTSACVAIPNAVSVGDQPAATPPQLVKSADGKSIVWNDPKAFGPVPADLVEKGAQTCSQFNNDKQTFYALGYHPAARDQDGNAFKEGGFFCVMR